MRTLLIIVLLGLVAVAAGASFVVQGGAQEPEGRAASIAADCSGNAPRGVDTLVHCSFSATNTGAERVDNPKLVFVPAPNIAIPERYFFFRLTVDGEERATGGSDTVYDFNPLDPGATSRLELDIIINASGRYGAEAQLSDGASGVLDRITFANDVIEPFANASTPTLELAHVAVEPEGDPQSAPYRVAVTNASDATARSVAVEVHPGFGATIGGGDWAPSGGARFAHTFGDMAPSLGLAEVALLESTSGECLYALPAAVATLTFDDGVVTLAALAELPSGCGSTSSFDAEDVGVTSLGQGGFGPAQEDVEAALSLVAMLAGVLGFAIVGVGIFVVR